MELRQLRSFVVLAEELNFTRAAIRCNLAQPSLTKQIQLLEGELGFELFDRSHRQIKLTEAGQVFLQEARQVLADLERSVGKARRAAGYEADRLRAAFPLYGLHNRVPKILDLFAQQHPEVRLEFHELYSPDTVRGLQEGWLDVGFLRAQTVGAGLSTQAVEQIEIFVFLPARHPLAVLPAVPFKQLADQRFILIGGHVGQHVSDAYRSMVVEWCQRAGFEPHFSENESWVQSDSATVRLVASGVGVHLALPSPQALVLPPEVVSRPLVDPAPYLELAVAWRTGEVSGALEAFLEVVRAVTRDGTRLINPSL